MKSALFFLCSSLLTFSCFAGAEVCILEAGSQAAQSFVKAHCTHKKIKDIENPEDLKLAKAKAIRFLMNEGFELKSENIMVRK